jgi:hypothetical protein
LILLLTAIGIWLIPKFTPAHDPILH